MYSENAENKDVNEAPTRPELSIKDKMVSSYLEDRSEAYRDLVKVQDDVSVSKCFPNLPMLR